MMALVPYWLLCFIPSGFLIIALSIRRRTIAANGLKPPVETKLLRSPGDGAYRKMKELDEKVEDTITLFVGLPATLLVFYLSLKLGAKLSLPGLGKTLLVMASLAFAVLTVQMFDTLKQRDRWRLGFRGERAVGEILNRLMLEGCHVFHDFPLGENWNLDHIVVAPSGIYAIETKTRSKGKSSRGQNAHEVIFDGQGLQYPNYYDTGQVTQAQNQADRLAKFLGHALQESIYVNPILTIPGWYVTVQGSGDVTVLNPKQIHSTVVKAAPVLTPAKIQRIARHLDDKCRDVEF